VDQDEVQDKGRKGSGEGRGSKKDVRHGGWGGAGGGVPRVSNKGPDGGGLTGEKGSNRFRLGGIRGWEVLGNMIGWGRV
jgi:hypothetical protein